MSVTRKAHEHRLMLSLFTAESAYDSAVTINGTNCALIQGQAKETAPEYPDTYSSDADEVNGSELPTAGEIPEKRVKLSLSLDRAVPNVMAGLIGYALGDITSTQDGAATSYRHYIVPVATGTAIPSMTGVIDPANRQEKLTGLKVTEFELSGEEGGYVKFSAGLTGSGTRSDSSESWVSALTERLFRMTNTKVYIKTSPTPASDFIADGAGISQATDNISSGQGLTSLGARVKSFSVKYAANPDEQAGAGGTGVLQDIDYGNRTYEVTLTLRYSDATERDYYDNLTKMSLEFNCKNPDALIDAGTPGTYYYGFIVRIAQAQVMQRAYPTGDPLEVQLTFQVQDDGTNPHLAVHVFNAKAAYAA